MPAFRAARLVGHESDHFPAGWGNDPALDEIKARKFVPVPDDGRPDLVVYLTVVGGSDDDGRARRHAHPPEREGGDDVSGFAAAIRRGDRPAHTIPLVCVPAEDLLLPGIGTKPKDALGKSDRRGQQSVYLWLGCSRVGVSGRRNLGNG